jgi:bifunctional enzyme CysN/CysC
MAHVSELIDKDIEAYLRAHEGKSLLRFMTCGSVDDGKSTLIGRLLYESKMIFEDQLAALAADSKQVGTRGDETSRTDTSRPTNASSSWLILPVTNSTRATW